MLQEATRRTRMAMLVTQLLLGALTKLATLTPRMLATLLETPMQLQLEMPTLATPLLAALLDLPQATQRAMRRVMPTEMRTRMWIRLPEEQLLITRTTPPMERQLPEIRRVEAQATEPLPTRRVTRTRTTK